MDFRKVDKKYRPIPFWSWNEKLDPEETKRQVGVMDDAGIGGFFMHARGGLLTEYMGDEWFENVRAASKEANERGMRPWAYDENGWPSGFGDQKVSGLGEEYQQKSLHIEPLTKENETAPHTVLIKDGYRYYYDVNEFYVDVLDRKVIARFIDEIYKTYAERVGDAFEGFFTDEPQLMRTFGYVWSFPLPDAFREKYGYDLIAHLDELFFEKGDYVRTRVDFWKLVTELFSKNYFKQICDFCTSHGYGFTGHLLLEETMLSQLTSSGASMPHYEYLTIPGMDWLGRPIRDCMTATALGSAAAQLGKKQVLSETFACCGHNVSHNELKRIYEWQMVRGVNLLCTHLEGYSLRGIRKRDYPPAMYYQQPWWSDMKLFFDTVSRTGMLLSEGKIEADTLLIHPQTSAWILYNGLEGENAEKAKAAIIDTNLSFLAQMRTLENKHILYHFGDEILLERHGSVEGKTLRVGEMTYTRVVLPENAGLLPNTLRLLDEFRKNGGEIVSVEEIPKNPVTEENALTYTKRVYPDFTLHYFVNSTEEKIDAHITVGAKRLVAETGETVPFGGDYSFAPYESILVIDDGSERRPQRKPRRAPLDLSGKWRVKGATYNSITLDTCDYSFDGVPVAKEDYVLNILPRLNLLRRPVKLSVSYRFRAAQVPDVLFVASETPELFAITCNGKAVDKTDRGAFRDSSFRLLDISSLVCEGDNVITFEGEVTQSEKTFAHLSSSWKFETMKNSLSYDEEVEQIYLVGNFGAKLPRKIEELPLDAYRFAGVPTIVKAPERVDIERLDFSGYPEFAGELTLEKTITVDDEKKCVSLRGRGINAIHLSVNGEEVAVRMFAPFDVDLAPYLKKGRNTLALRLVGNLRNMQGPFHLKEGESLGVAPGSFYKESNVFNHRPGATEEDHSVLAQFDDRTCLVHTGVICENKTN